MWKTSPVFSYQGAGQGKPAHPVQGRNRDRTAYRREIARRQQDTSEHKIEDFIHNKAIDFAKRKLSITYLLTDVDDGQLLGYFTLAHKAIDIDGSCLSGSDKKRLSRYARYDQDTGTYSASAFLLAQFGKNYAVDSGKRITGKEMMEYVMDILVDIQHRIGGVVFYLGTSCSVNEFPKPMVWSIYSTCDCSELIGGNGQNRRKRSLTHS